MMPQEYDRVADLLEAIWRGIPADYKSRYRRNIWDQFENQVRAAAYTSKLGKFVNSLCSHLQATVGKTNEERVLAEAILNSGDDKAILKLLRDETKLLVLMVRVRNQSRQDDWKKRQAEKEQEEKDMLDPMFGLPKEEQNA